MLLEDFRGVSANIHYFCSMHDYSRDIMLANAQHQMEENIKKIQLARIVSFFSLLVFFVELLIYNKTIRLTEILKFKKKRLIALFFMFHKNVCKNVGILTFEKICLPFYIPYIVLAFYSNMFT